MSKVYIYYSYVKLSYQDIIKKAEMLYSKANLDIYKDSYGKPWFNDASLFLSISHCDGFFVFALSDINIGVDAEKIREYKANIFNKLYSNDEKKYVLSSENIDLAFYEIWTQKEAYIKHDGRGISIIKSVDVKNINLYFNNYAVDNYMISICTNSTEIEGNAPELF